MMKKSVLFVVAAMLMMAVSFTPIRSLEIYSIPFSNDRH